jgi:ABC-type branched-subunit amino acid transport system ATPase component
MDVALNLADNVVVLHMGKVVAEGSPAMIKQNSQVKEIYLGEKRKE